MADGQTLGEANSPAARASFVDCHCHIDMPQFDADRAEVVARAREAGVEDDADRRRRGRGARPSARAGRGRGARAARFGGRASRTRRGWRPTTSTTSCGRWRARRRIVAIGEIGLDFYYDHSPRDAQREVFRRQVRLAREVGLPVIIHTREADDETATILEEEAREECGGVIHCFTGGHELARRALALGFYISFSGIVAFPRAEVIQEVARTVPARPPAGRDRRAVPGAAAAPRQAQRAGVRGRGRAQGRGAARRAAGGVGAAPRSRTSGRLFARWL